MASHFKGTHAADAEIFPEKNMGREGGGREAYGMGKERAGRNGRELIHSKGDAVF